MSGKLKVIRCECGNGVLVFLIYNLYFMIVSREVIRFMSFFDCGSDMIYYLELKIEIEIEIDTLFTKK